MAVSDAVDMDVFGEAETIVRDSVAIYCTVAS